MLVNNRQHSCYSSVPTLAKYYTTLTHRMAPPDFPFARDHDYQPPSLNQKLRHECPATKVKLYDGSESWLFLKHKDICQALSSEHLSADRRTPGYPEIHSGGHKAKEAHPTFVNLDNPEHNKQRNMLEDAFTPEAIEKLKPMIQETVNHVIDDFVKKYQEQNSPIDLIEELATPIPTQIIYRVLGVPDKDIPRLSQDSAVRTGTSRTAAEQSNQNLQDYMASLVDTRIEKPQDDMISKLTSEQYHNGRLSRDDIVQISFMILTAGNAALINSIGLGVLTLLQHPDQLDELKKDSSLAPQVVNELLRYNTTSALNSRRAVLSDTQIGGVTVHKGESVICSVQSGDRDEDKTEKPELFDIHRKYSGEDVLGFGYGPHRCLGEALSRAELEAVFATLFQKAPELKLAVKFEALEFSDPKQNAGVTKLPVTL